MIRRAAAILTCLACVVPSAALGGCTTTSYSNPPPGAPPPQPYSNYQNNAPPPPAQAPMPGQPTSEESLVGRSPGVLHPAVVLPGVLPSVQGSTLFGNGTVGVFRGLLYALPTNTTRLPDFAAMRPVGQILTDVFAISPQDFRTGFPGLLPQTTFFGIQYEGPLVVTGGQYVFQVDSDDGSVLYIDGNKVLTDDGTHPAELVTSAPIALGAGTHRVRLDYFQGTGPVALGVWIASNGGKFTPMRERN